MRNRAFIGAFALAALGGLTACAVEDEPEADVEVTEEVMTQPTTRTVEVPAVDTAVLRTEVDVDTMVDREVIEEPEIEGEDPNGI